MSDDTDAPTGNPIYNVPNQLTVARLGLAVVVFVLIPLGWFTAALVIFVIAATTDWVDGFWARRFGQVTQLGRILDPFADKVIICGTFIFLAAEPDSGIAAWVAVTVMVRELLVTALRSFFEEKGVDFSAGWFGKLKMVFQCVVVVSSLLALRYAAESVPEWILWTREFSVYLAVITTIYSGLQYVVRAAAMLKG